MTRNQYIAQVLRAHASNLSKLLNEFDCGALAPMFEDMVGSLVNVSAELVKVPSPAMAPGTKRQRFDPKPNSTVVKPTPKPRKPAPAAMVN